MTDGRIPWKQTKKQNTKQSPIAGMPSKTSGLDSGVLAPCLGWFSPPLLRFGSYFSDKGGSGGSVLHRCRTSGLQVSHLGLTPQVDHRLIRLQSPEGAELATAGCVLSRRWAMGTDCPVPQSQDTGPWGGYPRPLPCSPDSPLP